MLLLALVFGTTFLVRSGVLFPIRATGTDEPKAVQISNITDTSFTVSFSTDSAVEGTITYGESENYGTVSLDERDLTDNIAKPHTVHSINITNLKPKTTYYFAVISGSTTYTNNDKPYIVTTATTLPATDGSTMVNGTVTKPDGTKPTEAVVYLSTDGSQTLSAIVKPDGTYMLDMGKLRNGQLDAFMPVTDKTEIHLNIVGDGLTSTVKVMKNQSTTIPTVSLSQDYDFTLSGSDSLTPPTDQPIPTGNQVFPQFSGDKPVNTDPQILTPEKNETFSDQQPQFTGTAPPNKTVEIVIHSTQEIRTTVRSDKFGTWTFRPTKKLAPGTHTIQITTKDEAGFTRTLIQTFVVNAEGSQFTEPSVSPIKSPTPTPSPTPKPTLTPTPTLIPTKSATPTGSITATGKPTVTTAPTVVPPTVTPTTAPSPTLMPTVTPEPSLLIPTQIIVNPTQIVKPTIDASGSNDVMLTAGIATIAMISGAVLFFLTQGMM